MADRFHKLRLRQLDRKLGALADLSKLQRPERGWIQTIRTALGMTTRQLAERIGVSQSSVSQYETRELEDRLTLGTLRKVADALDCELVYALVPRGELQSILQNRARELARRRVEQVSQTMRLEDQEISAEEKEQRIEELTEDLLKGDPRRLWDEE